MKIEIKNRKNLEQSLGLKTLLPNIKADFSKPENATILEDVIRNQIEKGKSPVQGFGFKPYSKSYKKKTGKTSPVDMTLTGHMLRSLYVKRTSKYTLRIGFDSIIATYHNTMGASIKKVIRRLLPTKRGEQFNYAIRKIIDRLMRNSIKKATKKR